MKTPTLLGAIGAILVAFTQIFFFILNLLLSSGSIDYMDYPTSLTYVINFIGIAGWILIIIFFVSLYKKQH